MIIKKDNITKFLSDSYFDVQGFSPSLDQSHVIRLLTKMTVGATTAFWSFMELKDYLRLHKKYKGNKNV